ncbi:hypothetical protein BKD26_33180 [Streptomyces sp. CB03238]|nr:hypothetical protein BKD26_33180 [Streptomyces sp. CB03238]
MSPPAGRAGGRLLEPTPGAHRPGRRAAPGAGQPRGIGGYGAGAAGGTGPLRAGQLGRRQPGCPAVSCAGRLRCRAAPGRAASGGRARAPRRFGSDRLRASRRFRPDNSGRPPEGLLTGAAAGASRRPAGHSARRRSQAAGPTAARPGGVSGCFRCA